MLWFVWLSVSREEVSRSLVIPAPKAFSGLRISSMSSDPLSRVPWPTGNLSDACSGEVAGKSLLAPIAV